MDFLQKKVADCWVRRFLIGASYLFSERLVFDTVVRFYLDTIIRALHHFSIFEFNNTANTLFAVICLFVLFFIVFVFVFMYFLLF